MISIVIIILLFKLHKTSKFRDENLRNKFDNTRFKKFFFDESRNDLNAIRDWLFERLHTNIDLIIKFFKIVREIELVRELIVNDYFLTNQKFLRLMSIMTYRIFDFSFRRKEIINISWYNNETVRNLFISFDLMILIIDNHKFQWRIEIRFIARFLISTID